MSNLNHNFEILKRELKTKGYDDETIQMCLRKGVFLYEYISDDSRLMESKLHTKDHF